jgi:mono/diheme cytochrome c family protein
MGRPAVIVALAIAVVGGFAAGLGWLLETPRAPAGASEAQQIYYRYCASCHGNDGRGSWRAALFLVRPPDLTDPARAREHPDRYLFDIIKHGGAPLGRPGMPAFGESLSDADIRALVAYLRTLSRTAPA